MGGKPPDQDDESDAQPASARPVAPIIPLARAVHDRAPAGSSGHLVACESSAKLTERYFALEAIGTRDQELQRIFAASDDARALCDPAHLAQLAPHCLFDLIDTAAFNPADYRFVRYDARAAFDGNLDYTGRRFGELHAGVYRDNLQHQICTAWTIQTRRYSELMWSRADGAVREFHRLIVPLRRPPAGLGLERGAVLLATRPLAVWPSEADMPPDKWRDHHLFDLTD